MNVYRSAAAIIGFLICWGFAPAAPTPEPAPPDTLVEGVEYFKQGCREWQLAPLIKSSETLARAAAASPEDVRTWYWRTCAEMHVVLYGMDEGVTNCSGKIVTEYVEKSLASAAQLVALAPSYPEGYALLSVCTGLKIADSPSTILWNGPKVAKFNKLALQHGKDNPRALYLVGTTVFNGSAVLGGKETALKHFLKAEELFEIERKIPPADPLAPRWGYAGTLGFIGKTYLSLKKKDEAKAYFNKTLAIDPGNPVATKALRDLDK